jgi:hypothetical protein
MSNMIELNYEQAHKLVESKKRSGFFWDGYTLVKWSPGHKGYTQTNGLYRNGKWGFASRFELTNKGTWRVPKTYVEHP